MKFKEYLNEGTGGYYTIGGKKINAKTFADVLKYFDAHKEQSIDKEADELVKKGKKVYVALNPYVYDVRNRRVVMWSDDLKEFKSQYKNSQMDI